MRTHPHNIQAMHVVRSLCHRHERATPPGRDRRAGPRAMSSADGDAGRAAPIGAPAQPPAQPPLQASQPFPPLPPPLCPVTAALLTCRPGQQLDAFFAQMLLMEGAQATDPWDWNPVAYLSLPPLAARSPTVHAPRHSCRKHSYNGVCAHVSGASGIIV